MKKISNSASRIVFIMLALTACIGLFTHQISENNFMLLTTAAFSFYFSKPADVSNTNPEQTMPK